MNVLARDWQIARAQAQATLARLFDESKHPRDPKNGEFTETGGSGGESAPPNVTKASIKANMKLAYEQAQKQMLPVVHVRVTANGYSYPKALVITYGKFFEYTPDGKTITHNQSDFMEEFNIEYGDASKYRNYPNSEAQKKFKETGHYGPWGIDDSIKKLTPEEVAKDQAERDAKKELEAQYAAARERMRPAQEAAAKKREEKDRKEAERKLKTPEIDHNHQPLVRYGVPFEKNKEAKEAYKSREEYVTAGASIARYKLADMPGDAYSMNRALRGQQPMTPELQKYIDGMDLAFERTAAPLVGVDGKPKKESWVYRSIGVKNEGQYAKGKVVQDNGFISTSSQPNFAENWGMARDGDGDIIKEADGLVVKITVPQSMKVVPILNFGGDREGPDNANEENEILLPRGTKFLVTKVRGRYIDMTVVP